ncbi:hypothetical protein NE471_28820, partial [Escherichia coli]
FTNNGGRVDAVYIVATPGEIAFIKPMIAIIGELIIGWCGLQRWIVGRHAGVGCFSAAFHCPPL